jgi:hypothetical protein
MAKKILITFLFIFSLIHQQSLAGSHSYIEYLDDLAKISKTTADRLKAAADSIATKTAEARIATRYGITSYDNFLNTVKNAENFGKDKTRALTVIDPKNPNITWDKNKTHVLMVSWMPDWAADTFYKPYLDKEFTVARDMWVTVSPEVKNFMKNYKGSTPIHFRLQQLLGLPIKESKNYFVESWVKPADLIRPCINKEVSDKQCELDTAPTKAVDPEHQAWFDKEKSGKYSGAYPFPWNRLGYTYDTAKSPLEDKFGLSEFVILPGKKIIIKSITPTEKYAQ